MSFWRLALSSSMIAGCYGSEPGSGSLVSRLYDEMAELEEARCACAPDADGCREAVDEARTSAATEAEIACAESARASFPGDLDAYLACRIDLFELRRDCVVDADCDDGRCVDDYGTGDLSACPLDRGIYDEWAADLERCAGE